MIISCPRRLPLTHDLTYLLLQTKPLLNSLLTYYLLDASDYLQHRDSHTIRVTVARACDLAAG